MNNFEIGQRLNIARVNCDMSMHDLATHIGIATSTVQRYEAGKINHLNLLVIDSMAFTMHVSRSWILYGTEDEKNCRDISRKMKSLASKYDSLNIEQQKYVRDVLDTLLCFVDISTK